MEQKRLVIFDLDGTLLDTLQDLTDATNYALSQHGFPSRTQTEVRQFVGNGIHRLIERAVPDGVSHDAVELVYADFLPYYRAHATDQTQPYRGMIELLKHLKASGMLIAVASNKADAAVQLLCRQYFGHLLDLCVGERAGIAKKPAPDAIQAILQQLDVDRTQVILVGDSEVDVATAQNAEVDLIAVSWGFRSVEELSAAGAQQIASTSEELDRLLLPN